MYDPGQHWSITLSDMVARCFHRILVKHMENVLTFNIRRKAFRSGDGRAESVGFLQQLIQKHKSELSLLNIAFVDAEKALTRCPTSRSYWQPNNLVHRHHCFPT